MLKKIIFSFIFFLLLFCIYSNYSFANESNFVNVDVSIQQESEKIIPKKLELSIKNSLMHIYGKENIDVIYSQVESQIKKAKSERSQDLIDEDLKRDSDWYKDEVVYMFYPDQFGVDED